MGMQEFPLVLFTVFTQMAVGLALLSATRQWAVVEGPSRKIQTEWVVVAGLLAIGIIAAFFHLGHPLGAVRMLNQFENSLAKSRNFGFCAFWPAGSSNVVHGLSPNN